jgi:hypothetical protein
MKTFILAITLLSLTFVFATAQRRQPIKPEIKQEQVTVQTMARQPASKAYVLDLTRRGTIYNIASDVDYNRIRVRTSKGDMTIAELLKKSGKNITGKLRVGMTSDIRIQKLGLARIGGGGLNYSCGDLACSCSGDDDCNDLFSSDKCGPIAVCYPDGCVCIRI